MQWTPDVGDGEWLRERLDSDWSGPSTMHTVVPRGFPAYVRIFHPAARDRPVGVDWPPLPYDDHHRAWDAFQRTQPEIVTENATWAETAAAFGTTMHALAQWHRITGLTAPREVSEVRDDAGWRYQEPAEGCLDAAVLATVAGVLAEHTGTPDDGDIAVWAGWGGLLGFVGETPSRARFTLTVDEDAPATRDDAELQLRHEQMLLAGARDPFNNVFRKPTWQPGVLSDEISRGPQLELPAREHVLFRGGVSELASPDWPSRAPWVEADSAWPESPSIVWPADRAWVLVTEVDFDSTVVGGSPELIAALVATPGIEALAIPAEADLGWEGDRLNAR